jgi:hypothetical protein
MHRWIAVFAVCCSLGAVGCGGSTPPDVVEEPPPPRRTPIAPELVTFSAGPISDTPPPVFGSAPFTLVEAELADLDDDGDVDLGWVAGTASTTTTHEFGTRPGTGDGGFTGDYGGSGTKAIGSPLLAAGNLLGVGKEGVAFATQLSATSINVSTVGVRIVGPSRSQVGGSAGVSGTLAGIAVGDWNGDAIDDLAILDTAGRRVVAFRSKGETGLEAAQPSALPAGTGAVPTALAAGHFGSAFRELVVALGTDGYVFLTSTGSGTFTAGAVVPLGSDRSFTDLVTGDFDDDGLGDVAGIVRQAGEPLRIGVLFGLGDGVFEDLVPTDLEAALGTTALGHLHAADLNGDSRTDLVLVAPALDRAVVLFSDAAGGFVPSNDLDLRVAGGTLGVHDLDGDGDLDLLVGDAATLETRALLNDGP